MPTSLVFKCLEHCKKNYCYYYFLLIMEAFCLGFWNCFLKSSSIWDFCYLCLIHQDPACHWGMDLSDRTCFSCWISLYLLLLKPVLTTCINHQLLRDLLISSAWPLPVWLFHWLKVWSLVYSRNTLLNLPNTSDKSNACASEIQHCTSKKFLHFSHPPIST